MTALEERRAAFPAPWTHRIPRPVRRTYWRARRAVLWPFTYTYYRYDLMLWNREIRSYRT